MIARPIVILVTILGAALAAAACSEHLNGGAACPALCPGQTPEATDTTFRIDHLSPVYDTTIASFPLLGEEGTVLLARIPQRADIRGIFRFDSLPNEFTETLNDTAKTMTSKVAHDALVWFTVSRQSVATTRGSDQIQFFVYDVDTVQDTTVSVLQSMFDSKHFLGASRGYLASSFRDTTNAKSLDTVIIRLDTAKVLAKALGDRKLRLGITAVTVNNRSDGVRLTISANPLPFVRYYASTDSLKDTLVNRVTANLRSTTPVTDPSLLQRLSHYPLIVQGAIPDSVNSLNIGGMPARRVYLRFELPPRIIDTANVIRATLMLHPKPQPLQLPGDTVPLYPWPVVSSNKVKTPANAANFIVSNTVYSLDSVQVVPSASTVVAFDFVNAVKNWQHIPDTLNTRSIVLRILNEGATPLETSFWSSFAPDTALRPHVRLQYVKRSSFGVP
ncbi:MAG TPA: hypothetical protein VFA43_05340 [Gemmatimonadaceae bacterium]|nr:hypothetical protein [Gemmatimonadaceae bacterium]